MRRGLAIAALIVLAVALVFLVTHARGPDLPDAGSSRDRADGRDPKSGTVGDRVERDGPTRAVPGGIVGTVRRGSRPAAARVEVRSIERRDHSRPLLPDAHHFETDLLDSSPPGAPVGTADAGKDGRFQVTGLGPGTYEVLARAADGVREAVIVTILLVGQRVEANVSLPERGVTLRGRAVWSDGRPYTGDIAIVPCRPGSDDIRYELVLGAASRVQPGEDGRFEVSGLAPGRVSISALLPGPIRVLGSPVRVPRKDDVVFTVDAGFLQTSGRVVDALDGRPVPGATILAQGDDDWVVLLTRTVCDDDGRFSVTTTEWSSEVVVRVPGYATFRGALGPVGEETVIRLRREARIRGRITAEDDGRPVAGVTVCATWRKGATVERASIRTTSDADGRYRLPDLPVGEISVLVGGGGWVARELCGDNRGGHDPSAVMLEAGQTATMNFRVVPAIEVEGRVVDSTGAALVGVEVRAHRPPCRVVTDAEGFFRVDALPAGIGHWFVAHPPGHTEENSGPHFAIPGEPLRIEIRIPARREVEVFVVEAGTSRPVSGAVVVATGEYRPTDPSKIGPWRTDTVGRAMVGPLPPGPILLEVEHDDFLGSDTDVDLRPDVGVGKAHRVEVELIRGLTISGRVVRPDGTPLRSGVWDAAPLDDSRWAMDSGYGFIEPEDEGRFRISGLVSGKHRVFITDWDEVGLECEFEAMAGTEGVRAELVHCPPEESSRSEVKITVTAERPVVSGRVDFVMFSGRGSTGAFGFDRWYLHRLTSSGTTGINWSRLSPRTDTRVWFAVYGCRDEVGRPLGAMVVGPVTPGTPEVTIRLGPGKTIEGVVRGPEGGPVRGARIYAMGIYPEMPPMERSGGWPVHDETLTAENGSYRLSGLRDGPYEIRCVGSAAHVPPELLLTEGGARDADFELREAARPVITVLDQDARPVSGATVRVKKQESVVDWDKTDPRGRARLGCADPALSYVLEVEGPGDRPDLRDLEVDPWSPVDGTIRLPAARIIAGVVRDRGGRTVSNAYVSLEVPGKSMPTWVDADGAFRFVDVPPGLAVLRASPGLLDSFESQEVQVEDSATDVVLVVAAGGSLRLRVASWPLGQDAGARLYIDDSEDYTDEQIDPLGRVTFPWVPLGRTATLVIGPIGPDELWVYERGLVPGEKTVSLLHSAPVRGRVVAPDGPDLAGDDFEILIEELRSVEIWEVEEDGSFVTPRLPRGTWTIKCRTREGGVWYTDRATVEAGGTVTLRPKKE